MIEAIRWKLACWLGDVLLTDFGCHDLSKSWRWKLVEWVFPFGPDDY